MTTETIIEASARTGISRSTITRAARTGHIQSVVEQNGAKSRYVLSVASVDAWVKRRELKVGLRSKRRKDLVRELLDRETPS